MNKYVKYIMIAALGLLLTNCAQHTYKIKKEGKIVGECKIIARLGI